jgi:hypothetical protein
MFKKITFFSTNDHELFKLLPFNRKVEQAHVKGLVESMKENGFIGIIQIIETSMISGKKELYVVDGQHRLAAAKQLGIEVPFQLTKLENKMDVAKFISELNTSAKSWGTSNFLEVWSQLGIEEYVKLKQVQLDTGFQITPLLEAYLGCSNQITYRKGIMEFPNEADSDKIVRQMVDLNQFLPNKAFCRRAIIRVMRNKKYIHKKMVKAVKDYVKLVGSFTENERELKAQLERLVANNC